MNRARGDVSIARDTRFGHGTFLPFRRRFGGGRGGLQAAGTPEFIEAIGFVPTGKLVRSEVGPQATGGVPGLGFKGDEFLFPGVIEAGLGVGVPLGDGEGVVEAAVGQIDIGEEAAETVARLVFKKLETHFLSGEELSGELGGLVAEVHGGFAEVRDFGSVDSPEADAGIGLALASLGVGDIDVEGIAVEHLDGGNGLAVIDGVVGVTGVRLRGGSGTGAAGESGEQNGRQDGKDEEAVDHHLPATQGPQVLFCGRRTAHVSTPGGTPEAATG